MKEFVVAGGILGCSAAYWLGGQELPIVKRGYKAIRRYGVPAIVLSMTLLLGAKWYLALTASGLLCLSLHLGYRNKVWLYTLTGLAMGAPSLILGQFSTLNVFVALVPMMVHTNLGWWSLKDNRFGWSWVALAQGWAIGVAYAYPTAV